MSGSVAAIAKIMKSAAASAAEAEVGALFMNAQLAAPMRVTLEELGWPLVALPPAEQPMAQRGSKEAKQSICDSIGLRIERSKVNSKF